MSEKTNDTRWTRQYMRERRIIGALTSSPKSSGEISKMLKVSKTTAKISLKEMRKNKLIIFSASDNKYRMVG